MMSVLALSILGYLLGSIPFGLLLTRAAGLGDIRAIGSGNIGATNVLRTGNRLLAAATLILDGGKGAVAVLIARHVGYPAPLCAGFAAFLGHLFPVWLKFRGGKGVATGLGVLLAEAFPVGILACLTWLVVAALSRYSSLAALVTFVLAPVFALAFGDPRLCLLALAMSCLIFGKHRANIARLRDGSEGRIGKKESGAF
jgi:glycerol-3-phosphate acyltransferase PlsY